ncbi:MAG: hypothetical protein KHZ77_04960 [Veillonella sp.]|uniref:hypothetical protein n=1 Tax=Veillonella sp. TaxID=1926307 RepID=UPI0025DF079E|nr:hypothetical protein [Veillonella sp.]MBS4913495.1 hypothetical protein [Veillonella sp.]
MIRNQWGLFENKKTVYYIIKLGVNDNIIVERVEEYYPDEIGTYVQHYIDPGLLGIKELATIKGTDKKLVLLYNRSGEGPLNSMASQLGGKDIHELAFLCCACSGENRQERLEAIRQDVLDDLVMSLKKTFVEKRNLAFSEGHTIRRLAMSGDRMPAVFQNLAQRIVGCESSLNMEMEFFNRDFTHDIYYRSSDEEYFVECHQDDRAGRLYLAVFKRLEVLDREFDAKTQQKIELSVALESLNRCLVNRRGSVAIALKNLVKDYLNERGYKYKMEEQPGWAIPPDMIYVFLYGENYTANVVLVDGRRLHIDLRVKKQQVHMDVYEITWKKSYESRVC